MGVRGGGGNERWRYSKRDGSGDYDEGSGLVDGGMTSRDLTSVYFR